MPTLIIEDGSIVAGANCYVDVDYVRTYADNLGLVVDGDDTVVEQQILAATGYLESFRDCYSGYKTDPTQSLQWPRTNVVIDRVVPVDPNEIPTELKNAQAQLCVEQSAGFALYPEGTNATGGQIIQETVDVITVKYSDIVSAGSKFRPATFATVETLLRPLFQDGCRRLKSMRV